MRHITIAATFMFIVLAASNAFAERHWPAPPVSPVVMHLAGLFLINGEKAQINDEVAVFDSNDQLVGSFQVTQSAKAGLFGDLAIFGNDPNTLDDEGAEADEPLTLRVWSAGKQKEFQMNSIKLTEAENKVYLAPSLPLSFKGNMFFGINISAE